MLKDPCWKSINFSRSCPKIHSQNHKIKENPEISNTQKPRNPKTQTKPSLFQTINNKINQPSQLGSLNQTNTNPEKPSQTQLIESNSAHWFFFFFWFHFLGLSIWFSGLIFWVWVFVLGFLYSASNLASTSSAFFDRAWKLPASDSSSFWWVRSTVSKDKSWAISLDGEPWRQRQRLKMTATVAEIEGDGSDGSAWMRQWRW